MYRSATLTTGVDPFTVWYRAAVLAIARPHLANEPQPPSEILFAGSGW